MMRGAKILTAAGAMLLLGAGLVLFEPGCTRNPTELDDVIDYYTEAFEWRMFVFSIVSPEDTSLEVIAEATTYHSMPDTFRNNYYMENGEKAYWTIFDLIGLPYSADVYLSGRDSAFKLTKKNRTAKSEWAAYAIENSRVGIDYGDRPELTVVYRPQGFGLVQDSIIVKGATTVPGEFGITSPADGDAIGYQDELQIAWTPSEAARGYLVYVFNRNRDSDRKWTGATSDTSIAVPLVFSRTPNPALFNDPAAGEYRIVVWAVDDGLYDFYNSKPNQPFQEMKNHLDYVDIRHGSDGSRRAREMTALGVFGSRVMRQVDVRLLPD